MLHAFVSASAENTNPLIPSWPDLIWGTFSFLVILFFFVWKILPRLNEALDARRDAIEGGLKRAEEAQAGARDAYDQYTAQLAEARAEAARIRDQARADGAAILAELKEQASAEAARIIENAKVQIDVERQSAVVSLRSEVGSLAIDLASGVVGEALTDDKKSQAIVDRFLAELEASEAKAETSK